MDPEHSASLAGLARDHSRRRFLTLSGVAAGGLAPMLGLTVAEAKKRRKKRRKKRSPLALAYECPGPPESFGTYQLISRVAQVFVAERSGTLRRIQFLISKDANSSGDYVVQLLRVDGGVPLHAATFILAGITIPEADVPEGESMLTANFNGPDLEAGKEYAAAIARAGLAGADFLELGFFSGTGNVCAGQVFTAQGEAFTEASSQDVVVSVFID